MTGSPWALAAGPLLAASPVAYAATATASASVPATMHRDLADIPANALFLLAVATIIAVSSACYAPPGGKPAARIVMLAAFIVGLPLTWAVWAFIHARTGFPHSAWVAIPLWIVSLLLFLAFLRILLPRRFRRALSGAPSPSATPVTHGSAHFGTPAIAARHLAPAAPADAFVLGTLPGMPDTRDARFRQDGHILTCAPTGAGKGIGAVIPNLLTYPGSAFVLDIKGENYRVTARARRKLSQRVALIDPFGITGAHTHACAYNWLDSLDPDSPDVVSRAANLAGVLVAPEGSEADTHWTDTARELLRGLLIHVAGLPAERRSMAELRRIVTALEDSFADTLADMLADPEAGQRIPARAAAAHLNRPERERGSVLSTVVRHTAWLDDPRLCATLAHSDVFLADLKRQPMTVYLAIPPDRLQACLGFVRGFISLALDATLAAQGRPTHRVAFLLDEFGQLGRIDRLADSVTILRGYDVQLWLFLQDLSQLKAVYPRWQSFLANTSQQFFGTADFDTARYLSNALGQQTIRYQTTNASTSISSALSPPTSSNSTTEHLAARALLTPDEVMRLGPTRPIVLISGEPPYLLNRLNYLTNPTYAGRFDPNPFHSTSAAQ